MHFYSFLSNKMIDYYRIERVLTIQVGVHSMHARKRQERSLATHFVSHASDSCGANIIVIEWSISKPKRLIWPKVSIDSALIDVGVTILADCTLILYESHLKFRIAKQSARQMFSKQMQKESNWFLHLLLVVNWIAAIRTVFSKTTFSYIRI